MSTTKNLGRVGFVPQGEYSASKTYARYDTLTYRSAAYVVLKDNVRAVTPTDDGVNYKLLVDRQVVDEVETAIGDVKELAGSTGNMQLYLPEHNTEGYYLNANGTPTSDPNSAYTGLIEVNGGEEYVFSATRSSGTSATTLRVHGYVDGAWNQQIATISIVRPAGLTKQVITIPDGINGVRISLYAKNRLSNIVFAGNNDGGRVTAYDNIARDQLDEAEYIFSRLLDARNLFDVSTATDGVVLDAQIANPTYGEPVANADFVTSDYIRVFAGQTYTGSYTNHIAYYDKDRALISIANQQFTTIAPGNAAYARIDINKTEFDPQRVVFAVGDALPAVPVDGVSVSLSDKIKIENVPNLFKATANLFNPATVRDGYYINHNTGVYTANAGFGASDFIPVQPNTTYTGNFTNHLVWFTLDRKRISGTNQTFTVTSPATAAFAVVDYNKSAITADKVMFVEGGELPDDYVPHFAPVNRIPKSMLDLDISLWQGKNILFYGDSITALINGDTAKRWSTYVSGALGTSGIHGRGVGGQTFAWNTTGFEVDANGNYVKRGQGTDNCLGCFCSWQRISSMIIDGLKDSINLVVIMGGTNDLSGAEEVAGGEPIEWTAPSWSASNNTDTQWAAATEYNGGDYDVSTLTGGILSTVMKIQARCPNAKIVLASPLSRWSSSTHAPYARSSDGKTTRDVADVIRQAAEYMSVPFIDITAACGINGWNYSQYISDGVHPNADGDKMLASAMISGLYAMWPKIN